MVMLDPPQPQRLEGIIAYARAHDWRLSIANRLLRPPSGWRGDGALVTIRNNPQTLRFVRQSLAAGIPVVDLTDHRPDFKVPRVTPDYAEVGQLVADHFAAIGMRHLLYFSTEWSHVRQLQFGDLRSRWREATRRRDGSPAGLSRFILADAVPQGKFNDDRRLLSALEPLLQQLPRPLGIAAYNDEEAIRVMNTCLALGLEIPDEIAIVGAGNDTIQCENQPIPVSSVMDDFHRNGQKAAETLDRLMNGKRISLRPVRIPNLGLFVRHSSDTQAARNPIVRQTLKLVCNNLRNPPSIRQLTEELGISRSTFDRLFQHELGHSLHDEVKKRRLALARQLLQTQDLPVSEISALCGFCNAGHFISTFKGAFGLTPQAFRLGAT